MQLRLPADTFSFFEITGSNQERNGIFVWFLIFGNIELHVPIDENEMQLASTVASWYKVACT